jgi:ACS family D-galactonate transporter-like MFS transporter
VAPAGTTRRGLGAAQWGLLALLVLSIFLNYIDRSNLSLAAPVMQKEFALSPEGLGKLFSAFFWTYALLQLFGIAGWLADRFPAGLVLAAGLFVWSAATILSGFVYGFAALFAARLLVGAGESVAYPCYCRIFASDIPAENRGVANALLDAGSKMGPALGTFIGGLLLARYGWRTFFVVLGGASLLWLFPWLWFMPRSAAAKRLDDRDAPSTLDILLCRSAWGTFLGHFCGNYFWFFLLTWLPTYLVNARGFTMDRMVRITSAAFFVIAAGTMAAGWISDRWIAAGASTTRVRKTVVVCGLTFSALALPVPLVHEPTAALTLLLLGCASFGTFTSNHWAITQTLAGPLAAGRWTSLQNGIGNLAGIVAAWLTGLVVEQTHSFTMAFVVAGIVVLAGALFWGLVVGEVKPVAWRRQS